MLQIFVNKEIKCFKENTWVGFMNTDIRKIIWLVTIDKQTV